MQNYTKSELLIRDELTGNISFKKKHYDQDDFRADLVLKMKIPQGETRFRNETIQFKQIFKNLPINYEKMYKEAELDIFFEKEINQQPFFDRDETKYQVKSFLDLEQCQFAPKTILKPFGQTQLMNLTCYNYYNAHLSHFIIKYNMLMITLQKFCGFKVKTYLLQEQHEDKSCNAKYIYFLLSMTDQNVKKIADRYNIKKQIDLSTIDLELNEPKDFKERDIWLNTNFIEYMSKINQESIAFLLWRKSQLKDDQNHLLQKMQQKDHHMHQNNLQKRQQQRIIQAKYTFMQFKKNFNRKVQLNNSKIGIYIIKEAEMSIEENNKYIKYCQDLYQTYKTIQRNNTELSEREILYVSACNDNKYNEGCKSVYLHIKRQRELAIQIKSLNQKYGYPYRQNQYGYIRFYMPSNLDTFFDKLKTYLLYKPHIRSPYSELTLFSNMERIKLAHLCLENYLYVQKLQKIGTSIFALNNEFQRRGLLSYNYSATEVQLYQGGLSNSTLNASWHTYFPFLNHYKNIYEYMGQEFAFSLMLKFFMIKYFLLCVPLSIPAQVINIMYFSGTVNNHYFSLPYLFVILFQMAIFIQLQSSKQDKFFENFVEQPLNLSFRYEYKGPFCRNLVTDSLNIYQRNNGMKQVLIRLFNYFVMLSLLVLEGIFFWQMRLAIVYIFESENVMSNFTYDIFSLPHFIFYLVYFQSNKYIFKILAKKIIKLLVNFQNQPTVNIHEGRQNAYLSVFMLGIEIIPILFFYLIERFQALSCYNGQCNAEFQIYAYTRFQIQLSHIIFRFITLLQALMKGGQTFSSEPNPRLQIFQSKFQYFLNFVKAQSKKIQIQINLQSQALCLFHYAIFSIYFPACVLVIFFLLEIQYVFSRIQNFRNGKRPIPITDRVKKSRPIFQVIKHIFLLTNVWAIIFDYELLEYALQKSLIQGFLQTQITENNVLLLKVCMVILFFLAAEVVSAVFQIFLRSVIHNVLDTRKKMVLDKYLTRKKQQKFAQVVQNTHKPLVTIFKGYSYEIFEAETMRKFQRMRAKQRGKGYDVSMQPGRISLQKSPKANNHITSFQSEKALNVQSNELK